MAFELAEIDRRLLELVELRYVKDNTTIKFQFPPIIKSDGKSVEYREANAGDEEPFALFSGANPRKISMEWSYIVTGGSWNDVTWNAATIAKIVKTIKKYFYTRLDKGIGGAKSASDLIMYFKAYDVVGSSKASATMSFRAENVSIRYSGELVVDGGVAWPLKTDVSMDIKLWTMAESNGDEQQKVPGLATFKSLTLDWM